MRRSFKSEEVPAPETKDGVGLSTHKWRRARLASLLCVRARWTFQFFLNPGTQRTHCRGAKKVAEIGAYDSVPGRTVEEGDVRVTVRPTTAKSRWSAQGPWTSYSSSSCCAACPDSASSLSREYDSQVPAARTDTAATHADEARTTTMPSESSPAARTPMYLARRSPKKKTHFSPRSRAL